MTTKTQLTNQVEILANLTGLKLGVVYENAGCFLASYHDKGAYSRLSNNLTRGQLSECISTAANVIYQMNNKEEN